MEKHVSKKLFFDSKESEMQLPADFGKHFNLYAAHGYEIEVYQIFSDKLLNYLKLNTYNFSIEFNENKIYIYDDNNVYTSK